ncbi:putative lipid II flippase FtsW [Nesterenkonia sp. MY13]|uniref:Probable peptidoglycan glycosyltransferase FtsW n=1 Tax=Nesterenkonia sedimenti TaxID=1463632 RepID=A0A7X8TK39_9MICC|nr:putative lipid II flippase FtsW [Nesterenkonia sedimenti]NLS10257.1 putative lipid II flippase FtsW [Nesterenkonia sedimenti]
MTTLRPVDDLPETSDENETTEKPSDGSAGRAWRAERAARRQERVKKFWNIFEGGNPYTNYWLVLGATIALAAIGLTMVLSSTSIDADGQPFTTATRQAVWAVIGVVGMFAMTLIPTRWMGWIGWAMMLFSAVLLALVAFSPWGYTGGGSTNWLRIGSVQGQPSELAKLALVLWGSAVLARKGKLVSQFTHWMMPFIAPGTLAVLVLVLAGGDLGTSIVIIVLVGAMIFAAGVAMRYFAVAAAGAIAAVALLMWITPYRMERVYAWLGTNCDGPGDPCYQTQQGIYALASGGFWGVGLGQSRQKWDYIPEVHNDFIFTIIGEELGLLGTFLVLGLFATLVVGIFRVANGVTGTGTEARFVKLVCMGIIAWLVGQAFINIAMVTGLLPVVGVPLPFISYGGSALTCALLAIGVVLNFARRQRLESQKPTKRPSRRPKRNRLAPLNA